jgi:hypothetical protein
MRAGEVKRIRLPKHPPSEEQQYRRYALGSVLSRLEHFNTYYGFHYNRVSVKNTRSQWGSCSTKANLSFTYKLIFLPQDLADYIIVHELCHLGSFDHSPAFWNLVARVFPDHRAYEKRLRHYHLR